MIKKNIREGYAYRYTYKGRAFSVVYNPENTEPTQINCICTQWVSSGINGGIKVKYKSFHYFTKAEWLRYEKQLLNQMAQKIINDEKTGAVKN